MSDEQLKFRAEIELLFRSYPWELSADNKELILRQAAKIGMGKLTPESVDWARQHLERMQEGRERLDQIALAETTNPPAPDMKRYREPTPGHVRLKPNELARELAAWGHVKPKEPPPPDWDIWGKVGDCELWQAVVLSLNFDPDYFALYDDGAGNLLPLPPEANELPPQVALHRLLPDKAKRDIEGRLKIAYSRFQPRNPLVGFLASSKASLVNDLATMGALFETLWPDLPQQFPRKRLGMDPGALERLAEESGLVRVAKPAQPDPTPAVEHPKAVTEPKPLHPKERTTLLKIVGVLAAGADLPSEPYKAARSIVSAAAALDVSISERSVADVLRAARDLVGDPPKD